jgi:predicted O-methyltransferase YrrM
MDFTNDWFTARIPDLKKLTEPVQGCNNILEVGSYEGMSACWWLQNVLSDHGSIVCVDPFALYEGQRERFESNTKAAIGRNQVLSVYQMKSYNGLAQLITRQQEYDFIYIDGHHKASVVFADAAMALGMLRQGGIMLFDDYEWVSKPGALNQPKIAVNAFLDVHADQLDVVMKNWQLAVRKK